MEQQVERLYHSEAKAEGQDHPATASYHFARGSKAEAAVGVGDLHGCRFHSTLSIDLVSWLVATDLHPAYTISA